MNDLEARIQRLEDIEEIKKLHYRYLNSLSFARWDDLPNTFTEDGECVIGLHDPRIGRESIVRLFKDDIGKRHVGKEWIMTGNPIIEVDGDKASGTWVVYQSFFPDLAVSTPGWRQSGIYHCRYVKKGGQWMMEYLRWEETLCIGPQPAESSTVFTIRNPSRLMT